MMLDHYLFRRPNSGNWQLRRMIPKAARFELGRAEFTKSLGVTCKRAAADRALPVLMEWDALIARTISHEAIPVDGSLTVPTAVEIEQAAILIGYERAQTRSVSLVQTKAALGADAYESFRSEIDDRHREAVRRFRSGDFAYWSERARRYAAKHRWHLPEDSDAFKTFTVGIAKAGIDTLARLKALVAGTDDQFLPSTSVREAIQRRDARAAKGETMIELFELYATRRLAEGHKRADTVAQDRKVIEQFTAFVGTDRSLRSISATEVREWRDTLAALPPAYRKHKANAGLSIRDAAAKAKANGLTGLSQTTVNKYLSTVSPLFAWARKDGYVDANPCDGLYYDLKKGKNRRPPFSIPQLNQILASPLFQGFERDGKEFKPGNVQASDWRYWIPLVCLFTGSRIGEICQLRIDDIQHQDGIDFLMIRHEEEAGQTTKSGHSRPAVVPSKLRQIGFLGYVQSQIDRAEKDGDMRLFPELKPNGRGQISWTPSRFWRNYLTRIGIKDGRDGFGAHSFRHSLTDQLRLAGYLDSEIAVVLGHQNGGVTAGYGQLRHGTVERISGMVESIGYEGVYFSVIASSIPQ